MTEEELRTIVRESVQRHLGRASSPVSAASAAPAHVSHLILSVQAGEAIGEGACLIEPTVRCTHCGYCQSFGY